MKNVVIVDSSVKPRHNQEGKSIYKVVSFSSTMMLKLNTETPVRKRH